jgi:hypothetical protein
MNVHGQAMSSSKREARSELEGGGAGAQAVESERLDPTFLLLGIYGSLSAFPDFANLLILWLRG